MPITLQRRSALRKKHPNKRSHPRSFARLRSPALVDVSEGPIDIGNDSFLFRRVVDRRPHEAAAKVPSWSYKLNNMGAQPVGCRADWHPQQCALVVNALPPTENSEDFYWHPSHSITTLSLSTMGRAGARHAPATTT